MPAPSVFIAFRELAADDFLAPITSTLKDFFPALLSCLAMQALTYVST